MTDFEDEKWKKYVTSQIKELSERVIAVEVQTSEKIKQQNNMEKDIKLLVEDMKHRQGEDRAERENEVRRIERQEEKGKWMRAFIPTGVWFAAFATIAWMLEQIGITFPGSKGD